MLAWLFYLFPVFALVFLVLWDVSDKNAPWASKLTDPLTFFTFLLVVVAALQWRTLEKTDDTIRSGQRAFVFFREIVPQQTESGQNQKLQWTFVIEVENNGNTQTKNLVVGTECERANFTALFAGKNQEHIRQRLLGPKQKVGGGGCLWDADALDKNRDIQLGGLATYEDIFDEPHVTRFCRVIKIYGDPKIKGQALQFGASPCQDMPDCADKECGNSEAVVNAR